MNRQERVIEKDGRPAFNIFSGDVFEARLESGLLGDHYYRAFNDWTVLDGGHEAALKCLEFGKAYLEGMNRLINLLQVHKDTEGCNGIVERSLETRALIERDLKSIEKFLELRS
jgi:hypothetical protein